MLRTSSYVIYVDLPDNRDEMLLVHGYTGAFDRVSTQAASFLRSRETLRPPKPLYGQWKSEAPRPDAAEPSDGILSTLKKRGYLTELDEAQEETFFGALAERLHQRTSSRPPSYIFMPTYDCNLRCPYCFQDSMRTDCSFKHLLRTMRKPIVDRIFAAMPGIEATHGAVLDKAQKRNIGFFGGEPLLAAQRGIVEHIMRRARELGKATFWAVTNATELDAYLDLLGPEGISSLQITLDGPPEEHDRRRVYADGSGSFERIAANIDLALERRTEVSIRLNIDRNNVAHLPALASEIIARGWNEAPGFSTYTAVITPSNAQTDRKTTFNTWQLDRAVEELHREHPETRLIGRPDAGIRSRARRIFEGEDLIPQLRPSFCGAHDQMYIFDPFGDVYACWEKTGDPDIRIGKVNAEGCYVPRFETTAHWRGRNVASNPVCRRCRYALHCGGGCAVLALQQSGKFHKNYCDGFASRFRSAVAEAYTDHLAGTPQALENQRVCDL